MSNFTVCGVKKAGVHYLARRAASLLLAVKITGGSGGKERGPVLGMTVT